MMTPDEHKAAAEKLTHAVKNNTNGAYDEWTSAGSKLKDADARAAFVQRHAGLSQKPTPQDMDAINDHVRTSLHGDVAEIKAKAPGEHVVGMICAADD
jgi:hypothetical protein